MEPRTNHPALAVGLRTERVDHIGIAVDDLEGVTDWYVEHGGMVVVHDEMVDAANVRLRYLLPEPQWTANEPEVAATMIQLLKPFGPGAVATHLETLGPGLHHVCLAVTPFPASDDPALGHPAVFLGGLGRNACFLDARPGGTLIELTDASIPFRRPTHDS